MDAGSEPPPTPQPSWSLYVALCADGTLYTGISTDVARRLKEHDAGRGARYTRGRGPVALAASWPLPDESSARRAEARFKRFRRTRKLRALGLATAP